MAEADWLGPKVGGCPALVLHSINERCELWHCLYRGHSIVNMFISITVVVVVHSCIGCYRQSEL